MLEVLLESKEINCELFLVHCNNEDI